MELADRHVVVTGAASGIGRALARRFAAEGARAVVVADLELQAVREVAGEFGGLAVGTDVGRAAEIEALVASPDARAWRSSLARKSPRWPSRCWARAIQGQRTLPPG